MSFVANSAPPLVQAFVLLVQACEVSAGLATLDFLKEVSPDCGFVLLELGAGYQPGGRLRVFLEVGPSVLQVAPRALGINLSAGVGGTTVGLGRLATAAIFRNVSLS